MHEFSIAQGMLTTLSEHLLPGQQLSKVMVNIGPLSGISAESLTFCFTELAAQAGLGQPALIVTQKPAKLQCTNCETIYETATFFVTCPQCSSLKRTIISGAEFTLDSMEVESSCG